MDSNIDGAWFDAQYNNRARVPGHAEILARWASDSVQTQASHPAQLDLHYGDSAAETLDVFPASRADAPVLFFIHGGYWRALDKSDHSFVAPAFVDAGATVVVPNYAQFPVVSVEEIARQMTRALAWTWKNVAGGGRAGGGKPRRIVVAGHSAGGHLAAMLLCCRWRNVLAGMPAQPVAAAVSVSGLFDLKPIMHTPFLQADLRLTAAMAQRTSPAGFAPPKSPLLSLVGADESEEFLRQNRLIRERWGAAAVPVCEEIAGANHFTVLDDLVQPAGHAHQLTLGLLGLAG